MAPLPRTKNGRVLGRLPAQIPDRLREFSSYLATPLPPAPASVKVPAVNNWGMLLNDEFGDCVCAGGVHAIAAWDLLVGETDAIPTADQCIAQYDALTGCVTAGDANDTGLVISQFLKDWATVGMFNSNRLAGYAPVAVASLAEIQQGIAAYGVVIIGINLPQSAETQFESAPAGTTPVWTYVGDAPIGGHCIILVGYGTNLFAITWGAVVAVTWEWMTHYLEEAWVCIPQAFVEAGKGPEVNLAELQADIGSLDAAPAPPKPKRKPKPKPWWSWAALRSIFER